MPAPSGVGGRRLIRGPRAAFGAADGERSALDSRPGPEDEAGTKWPNEILLIVVAKTDGRPAG
jgi:hypothetical protein